MRYIAAKVSEGKEVFQGFPAVALSPSLSSSEKDSSWICTLSKSWEVRLFCRTHHHLQSCLKSTRWYFSLRLRDSTQPSMDFVFLVESFPEQVNCLFLALPSVSITRHASVRRSSDDSTWCKPVFTLSFPRCQTELQVQNLTTELLSLRNKMCLLALRNYLQTGCNRTGSSPRFSAQVWATTFGTVITSLSTSGLFPLSSINF